MVDFMEKNITIHKMISTSALISFIPFLLTAVFATLFRTHEVTSAALQLIILFYLFTRKPNLAISSILFALLLTLACYICIKYFNMFRFSYTHYTPPVPLWLPVTWAIVFYFALFIKNLT